MVVKSALLPKSLVGYELNGVILWTPVMQFIRVHSLDSEIDFILPSIKSDKAKSIRCPTEYVLWMWL
jgi:hypothetical protein